MSFVTLSSLPAREIFNGALRGHYAHLERLTIGEVQVAPGTELPMHQHPHEQFTLVLEGRLEFTVAGETRTIEAGQGILIPSAVVHGGRTITACRLLDVFTPVREDYRS